MAVYIDQKRRATYAGIWDKTKAYNPYSIVTTENGYFLSASPVPAGIDITNNSYWIWYAGSGDSSTLEARVTSLESRVDILSSTLNIIGADVDNLSTRTTNTENDVTILASTFNIVGSDIDAINRDAINFTRMITGIN